jgi:hypothetical protein
LKSITQVPSAVKEMVPELSEQPLLEGSSVIATARADVDVAVGV